MRHGINPIHHPAVGFLQGNPRFIPCLFCSELTWYNELSPLLGDPELLKQLLVSSGKSGKDSLPYPRRQFVGHKAAPLVPGASGQPAASSAPWAGSDWRARCFFLLPSFQAGVLLGTRGGGGGGRLRW